ncbi:MAG: chitobiase/beta-hexosaminidase C-terminal domain-containing protein, partial [Patescibacteria group bacterium]
MIIKKDNKLSASRDIFRNNGFPEISVAILLLFVSIYLLYTNLISADYRKVDFSKSSGFYQDPIELTLHTNVIGAEIRYSTDGSEPTLQSTKYTGPLELSETATVKARLFRKEKPLGLADHRNIFINEHSDLAVIALTADAKDLWDENEGIYNVNNYKKKGEEWHKNGIIEFYNSTDSKRSFIKDVEFRIYGGETRRNAQKSLKLCTGSNDSIKYELFPGYKVDKFKCVLLRNSGSDWKTTMFKDALLQEIIRDNSQVTTQNYRPVILFINGKYWGIHNLREYYNDNYLSNKYQGRRQDYAILFPDRDDKGRVQIEAGTQKDADDFYALRSLV